MAVHERRLNNEPSGPPPQRPALLGKALASQSNCFRVCGFQKHKRVQHLACDPEEYAENLGNAHARNQRPFCQLKTRPSMRTFDMENDALSPRPEGRNLDPGDGLSDAQI